ncbi:MAG: TonB-dependent receptor [Deltaproteobacteria bacterium]|nr:TonB-dependent receptor [Deltaproteobacteria bacterium]
MPSVVGQPILIIRRLILWTLVLGVLWGTPVRLLAEGTQTGVLAGKVFDPTLQPLPQVAVTLTGPRGSAQAVTDSEGRFRFPSLDVGLYEARAELLGLRTSLTGIRVFIDRTTEVTLNLGPDTEASPNETVETIQVVAVAPLLDRFETRIASSISREFLDQLPLERFYQSVALALPAVVGGLDGNPNVSGAGRSNNLFLVDGVDTTDPTTGLFGLNLSYEAVEEVAVTLAALPVEWGRVSGAPINVVTRSGGQEFHGSGRWLAAGAGLTGDYRDESPILAPEVEAANSPNKDLDNTVAVTFSGPLIEDRLWFFGALERAESRLFRPTLEGTRWNDGSSLSTNDLKISSRPGTSQTLVGQFTSDRSSFTAFSIFDRSPAENRIGGLPRQLSNSFLDRIPGDVFALQESSQEGDFTRLSWDWVAAQNLVLTAAAALQQRKLERQPTNSRGVTGGAPHVGDNPIIDFALEPLPGEQSSGVFNGITDQGFENRDRDQASVAATAYLRTDRGEHELRLGLDVQRTTSTSKLNFSGPSGIDPATGRSTEGRLFFDTDLRDECLDEGLCLAFDPDSGEFQPDLVRNFWFRQPARSRAETLALYASESLSIGRWLFTIGARFETVQGSSQGSDLVDDSSIAPRLGVKLDPRNDGKTLISATFGRSYEAFPQALLDSFIVPFELSGYSEYQWIGGATEGSIGSEDCADQDPADLSSPCWQFFEAVPLDPLQQAEPNLGLRRSSVDELTLGVEHQLTANTDLRLTYVDRQWNDLWDDLIEFGEDELGEFILVDLENLPQARRSYEGLMILLRKRLADRWQLLASYTWSRAEGNLFVNSGRETFADFQEQSEVNLTNRFGLAPFDRTQQLKLFANYDFSFGRAQLTAGTAFRFEDGIPFQQESTEDLGVRFRTRRGSERLEEVFQWDLSLNLSLPTAKGIELLSKIEVFNVTGENTRIGTETDIDSGIFGSPRSLADLQRPRAIRLSLGFRF